jgi:hypothetical protein
LKGLNPEARAMPVLVRLSMTRTTGKVRPNHNLELRWPVWALRMS